MRGGHGRAGKGLLDGGKKKGTQLAFHEGGEGRGGRKQTYSATVGPGRDDVDAGGGNVDVAAVVGVYVAVVVDVGGADAAAVVGRGRGDVAGVLVLVAGGDADKDAAVREGVDGVVDGLRVAAAEGHVDKDALGTAAVGGVAGDVVDGLDDVRVVADALALLLRVAEDLEGVDLGLLGHAVGAAADDAGDVRAVAAVVVVGTVAVLAGGGGAALELLEPGGQKSEERPSPPMRMMERGKS